MLKTCLPAPGTGKNKREVLDKSGPGTSTQFQFSIVPALIHRPTITRVASNVGICALLERVKHNP
jgi:hypothetical protein